MVVDPAPFKLEWQAEKKDAQGLIMVDRAQPEYKCVWTSLLSFFISFRSEASAGMRGFRGRIASNVRDKIEVPGSMIPYSLPTVHLQCIS